MYAEKYKIEENAYTNIEMKSLTMSIVFISRN